MERKSIHLNCQGTPTHRTMFALAVVTDCSHFLKVPQMELLSILLSTKPFEIRRMCLVIKYLAGNGGGVAKIAAKSP